MDLMDRISDLLPLLILIALSSSSKKKRKKKPVKREQMQVERQDEMVTNIKKEEKKPVIKKETAAFGLFGQLKQAFEEEMRKMEEGTEGPSESKGYKPKRYREEAESLNFQGPKKHEDLALYKLRPRYDDRKSGISEKIIIQDGQKSLNKEDILRGIIFAEILSPPKSKRG